MPMDPEKPDLRSGAFARRRVCSREMRFTLVVLAALFSTSVNAQFRKGPSDDQIAAMARANEQVAQIQRRSGELFKRQNVRPFYEYGKTGYLVFSDDDFGGIARDMKKQIAQNLPDGVGLIVYTQSSSKNYHQQLLNTYASYLPRERVRVLQVPRSGANDFWSRDNTPVPVFSAGFRSLVDALYYYNFEPDQVFARLFNAPIAKHRYFFEGGNFMANALGDCIVVNRRQSYPGGISDTAAIPDEVFLNQYGCRSLTRLPHLKGIGHSDEVVKFMSDNVVVTDTPQYVSTLRQKGFEVVMLPEPDLDYETYVNSLQVNDVLYVPVFGERGDAAAINAYKTVNPNLKIVPINSRRLATQGQGGIHCITMNYPPGPLAGP